MRRWLPVLASVLVLSSGPVLAVPLEFGADGLAAVARPNALAPRTIETEHFMIHYDDASVSPAYADSVAAACERSWHVFHVEMVWDLPPGDGTHGGGQNKIDCWIQNMTPGGDGYTALLDVAPGDAPYDWTAEFYIDDTLPLGCHLDCEVAHEYFHVVEYGYYGFQTFFWFTDQCAMMGEEWVYPDCDWYENYLPSFFTSPYRSISTHNGAFEFGSIVWPMYLSERFTPGLVEAIWDLVQWNANIWTSTDAALTPYGHTFETAYLEFIRWCFYTASRCDDHHFSDACSWLASFEADRTLTQYPTGTQHPSSTRQPESLGTSMMKFVPQSGSTDDTLVVYFDGPPCTLGVQLIVKRGSSYAEYAIPIDAEGDGTIALGGFAGADYVFMMTSMKRSCSGGGQDYAFSAETRGISGVEIDAGSAGGPIFDPVRPNPTRGSATLIYRLPLESTVAMRILAADGRCLRTLVNGPRAAGVHEVVWDGRDDSGRALAPGRYWVTLDAGMRREVRELILLQ